VAPRLRPRSLRHLGVCRSIFQTSPGRKWSSSSRGKKILRWLSANRLLQRMMDFPFNHSEYCIICNLSMQGTLAASARHPANTHTHTPHNKMACHFAAQALCLLSSATSGRQEGHTLADVECTLGHGVPSSAPAYASSIISETNPVSMHNTVAQAGSLTFQAPKARLDRFSSLMMSVRRCACNSHRCRLQTLDSGATA